MGNGILAVPLGLPGTLLGIPHHPRRRVITGLPLRPGRL